MRALTVIPGQLDSGAVLDVPEPQLADGSVLILPTVPTTIRLRQRSLVPIALGSLV